MASFLTRRKQRKDLQRFIAYMRDTIKQDDDILSAADKRALQTLCEDADNCLKSRSPEAIETFLKSGEDKLKAVMPPKKMVWLRELLDLLAVVGAVAFGIRGLFFQPFVIPTGSMQPTLFGEHFVAAQGATVSPYLGRNPLVDLLLIGAQKAELNVIEPGYFKIESLREKNKKIFWKECEFTIGDTTYTLPGPARRVIEYAHLNPDKLYEKGQVLADGYFSTGDSIFVDRLTHYLRELKRGDIVVFSTDGISYRGQRLIDLSGYYYVKRLVGLPGDTLKLVDTKLFVKPAGESEFKFIRDLSPAFEKIYSYKGGYQGYLGHQHGIPTEYLGSPDAEYTVPEDHYFMLGDNTASSLDSRNWGPVPRRNLVGIARLVWYPATRRWGVADSKDALNLPTFSVNGPDSMQLQ